MDIDSGGMYRFVLAMYAKACNDLVQAYRKSKKAKNTRLKMQAQQDAESIEEWIRNDPYCILGESTPDRIIKAVQDKARRGGQFHFEFQGRKNDDRE